MQGFVKKASFYQWLLILSVIIYFIDFFLSLGIFYVTIPVTCLIGIIACIFAIKEKNFLYFVIGVILTLIPMAHNLIAPW